MENINHYIDSGILEMYVLGITDHNENETIMRMAFLHPEIKAEIERICTALHVYINLHTLHPEPTLKKSVLEIIKALQ